MHTKSSVVNLPQKLLRDKFWLKGQVLQKIIIMGKESPLLYATDVYVHCGLCARRPLPYAHFFLCSLLNGVSPACLIKTPR